MKKNKKNVLAGKKGAEVRWEKPRFELLVELSKIYGKEHQDDFMKRNSTGGYVWSLEQLNDLIKYNREK